MSESQILYNAKSLRKSLTKEERRLWYDYLKNSPYKWYKQKVFGNYILDFYCSTAKLGIELDGSQHYEEKGLKYDVIRTAWLNENGIYIYRITNVDVNNHFEEVCCKIDELVRDRDVRAPLSQLR